MLFWPDLNKWAAYNQFSLQWAHLQLGGLLGERRQRLVTALTYHSPLGRTKSQLMASTKMLAAVASESHTEALAGLSLHLCLVMALTRHSPLAKAKFQLTASTRIPSSAGSKS